MQPHHLSAFLVAVFAMCPAGAAQNLTVTVVNPNEMSRPSETISVPWAVVEGALPGALLQHLAVRDSAGSSLPYQVTNIDPEARDSKNVGVAYGDLIFQHDFAAGEKSATFTVEPSEAVQPVFPARVFARYVPERLDDFAWENDKIAHRTYGTGLTEPDLANRGKEVVVSSGIDVWCKRVSYLVVDRWYNKGHNHYHKDEGEGMDMYEVRESRGCGGTGVWDGSTLAVSRNYRNYKVLANGPVRAIFELSYDVWNAHGRKVIETKRYTVDAGHNLDQVESTFKVVEGAGSDLTIGIGLDKNSADKGQEPRTELTSRAGDGSLAMWVSQRTNGSIGTAVIVPKESFLGFAADEMNELVLASASPGKPVRYYAGAGWSKAGEFTSRQSWDAYIAAWVARIGSPVTTSFSAIR